MKFKDFYLIAGSICWLISLTSILLFKKPKYLKVFSFFILISILVEWSAWYLGKKLHLNNLWLYNLYILAQFLFLPNFYAYRLKSEKIEKFVRYFSVIYSLFYILNLFYIQGFFTYNTYSYITGMACVLFLIIIFFKRILLTANDINLFREPLFFVSSAYFLFFTIELPYTAMLPYFAKHDKETVITLLWIIKILNIVLYLLFSFAFLCKPKTQAL